MNKYVFLIFSLAFTSRLLLFIVTEPWDDEVLNNVILVKGNDPLSYQQLAINIIEHQSFTYEEGLPPTVLRTPGYPLFISVIYKVFGYLPWLVLLIQIVIESLSGVFLYAIFSKSLGERTGFITGLLYALNPYLIIFSLSMYSDTIFVFFIIIAFLYFNKFSLDESGKLKNLILSSIFLGAANLIKPAAIAIILIIIGFLLLKYRSTLKKGLKYSLVFTIFFIITLSPWLIRNYIIFDNIVLSISGEYNLLVLNVAPMEMENRKQSQEVVIFSLLAEADTLMRKDGQVPLFNREPNNYWEEVSLQYDYNKAKYWRDLAVKYITKDPFSFIKHYSLGILHTFINLGTSVYSKYMGLEVGKEKLDMKSEPNILNLIQSFFTRKSISELFIAFFIVIYLLIVYSTFVVGLFQFMNCENKYLLYLSLVICIYFVLIAGTGGLARFKMPAIPFYIGFSAIGLNHCVKLFKKPVNKGTLHN